MSTAISRRDTGRVSPTSTPMLRKVLAPPIWMGRGGGGLDVAVDQGRVDLELADLGEMSTAKSPAAEGIGIGELGVLAHGRRPAEAAQRPEKPSEKRLLRESLVRRAAAQLVASLWFVCRSLDRFSSAMRSKL